MGALSANFALCSDFALTLGGKLKFAEFTSGRYADVSYQFILFFLQNIFTNQLNINTNFSLGFI